jgi:predicted nucleic acid-binding protein
LTITLVADSSVLVAAALNDEVDHPEALAFLDAAALGRIAVVAADLARIELAAAVLRAARRGRLAQKTVPVVAAVMDGAPITWVPSAPYANIAIEFAWSRGTSLYDALPAMLARRHGLMLVSTDRRLMSALASTQAVLEPGEVLRSLV